MTSGLEGLPDLCAVCREAVAAAIYSRSIPFSRLQPATTDLFWPKGYAISFVIDGKLPAQVEWFVDGVRRSGSGMVYQTILGSGRHAVTAKVDEVTGFIRPDGVYPVEFSPLPAKAKTFTWNVSSY